MTDFTEIPPTHIHTQSYSCLTRNRFLLFYITAVAVWCVIAFGICFSENCDGLVGDSVHVIMCIRSEHGNQRISHNHILLLTLNLTTKKNNCAFVCQRISTWMPSTQTSFNQLQYLFDFSLSLSLFLFETLSTCLQINQELKGFFFFQIRRRKSVLIVSFLKIRLRERVKQLRQLLNKTIGE